MTTYEQERTEQQRVVDDEILKRVQAGLAWLQETHGPGWEDKIDLATLDLSCGEHCVLGQMYSGFGSGNGWWYALEKYFIPSGECYRTGVPHPSELGFTAPATEYSKLTETWRSVLTPRVEGEFE